MKINFPADQAPIGGDQYDALPDCIKQYVSRKEYAWMPDEQKQTLEQDLTDPDVME